MSARAIVAAFLAAAVAAPGCVTTTQEAPGTRPGHAEPARTVTTSSRQTGSRAGAGARGGTRSTAAAGAVRGQSAVDTDPCAKQLHAIAGAMLMHYAVYKRLPDALEGLRALGGIDEPLNFACPVSGARYGYSPTGLQYQGRDERLIVYDATPAHGGKRWGILAAPPKGDHPAATWVVQLPEGVFRIYQAPPQLPAVPDGEPGPEEEGKSATGNGQDER